MSSSATAAAKIEITIPQENLVRVLVIDDDELFLPEMKEFFSSNNYSVDLAKSPEEATRLLKANDYEIVIADVNFEPVSSMKGDRFVLKNPELFGKAKVVIVTGEGFTQQQYDLLRKKGIKYLEKGEENFSESLEKIAQQKAKERKNDLVDLVQQTVSTSLGTSTGAAVAVKLAPAPRVKPSPTAYLMDELKQMLVEWLGTRAEGDEIVLAYGTEVYSANDMIQHIENETDVGLDHVRLLVNEIKYSMGLDEDESEKF